MMKSIKRTAWFLTGALFVLLVPRVTEGAFQEVLWGARPAALVGAYTALADDANSPAYNPAGISLTPQTELTFMYAQLYTGLNLYSGTDTNSKLGLNYFSFVPDIKDKRYGSYAISWSNFSASSLYKEDTFTLSAADSFEFESIENKPILSYGANLKLLKRSFTTDSRTSGDRVFSSGSNSDAFTIDLGLIYQPNLKLMPGLRFGAAGQNLTEPDIGLYSTDRVPARYSVGAAYSDPAMPLVGPAVDVSRRNGRTVISGAWESWISREVLALRIGGNADQLGGGIGYQFKLFSKVSMQLDYAILWPLNIDGTNGSHRMSISTRF